MHPTADTTALINPGRAARRVIGGVRLLVRCKNSAGWMRGRGGWRDILIQVSPAMVGGLASGRAGGGRHGAG